MRMAADPLLADTSPRGPTPLTFEQPLNERVRTWLRLEHLFRQAQFAINGETEWHHRFALQTLLDLLDLLARGDVKSEQLKELGRITERLGHPASHTQAQDSHGERQRRKCETLRRQLTQQSGSFAASLREHDLLATLMQRSGIAGGVCGFDLPRYQHWLQRQEGRQRETLEAWYGQLLPLYESTLLLLSLIRRSGSSQALIAVSGTWQCSLDRAQSLQLLQVRLPADSLWYPEISASMHYVTLRFLRATTDDGRPQAIESDVDFTLRYCTLP
jgi:cell division protein ZapD